jgi:hypothetical protein
MLTASNFYVSLSDKQSNRQINAITSQQTKARSEPSIAVFAADKAADAGRGGAGGFGGYD